MNLAVVYAFLAGIATLVNIGAQDLTLRLYSGAFSVPLSVAVGTLAGLVVKYVLDKRYIFRFQARDMAHDSQTFILYTAMGLATPVIFAAGVLKLPSLAGTAGAHIHGQVIVGAVLAGLASYISIRWLTRYFETRTLTPFAIYSLIAGITCIIRFA